MVVPQWDLIMQIVDFLFHNIGPLYYHCVNPTLPINSSAHGFRKILLKSTQYINICVTVNGRNTSQNTPTCPLLPFRTKRNTIKLEDIHFKDPKSNFDDVKWRSQLLPSNIKVSSHIAWWWETGLEFVKWLSFALIKSYTDTEIRGIRVFRPSADMVRKAKSQYITNNVKRLILCMSLIF